MPLRARAVDRVGNVGPELARNIGAPPSQFTFAFGDGVNAAGNDSSQMAWMRPGVAGNLRVTAADVEPSWPDLGAGWTVERDLDTAVYSFTAEAAPPLIVAVNAGPSRLFDRLLVGEERGGGDWFALTAPAELQMFWAAVRDGLAVPGLPEHVEDLDRPARLQLKERLRRAPLEGASRRTRVLMRALTSAGLVSLRIVQPPLRSGLRTKVARP